MSTISSTETTTPSLPSLPPIEERVSQDQQCLYKHLMKCYGPQDRTFAALYEAKDATYVTSLPTDVLATKLKQVYNDHKDALPQIITISRADDIITYPGLGHLMRLILGLTSTRYRYMCAGEGPDKASPFQQGLILEKTPRIDMNIAGSYSQLVGPPVGIRYQANFPASHQTMTVTESAINTSPTVPNVGIYLNRNVFSSTPITHNANVTAFTLQTDITFTPL